MNDSVPPSTGDGVAASETSSAGERGFRGPAALRALQHRNFRLYFGGQFVSLIGTWMQTAAQAWLVLKLTNSPLMLGVVSFANYSPVLLVALFAGVIVDRADRRRLIVVTQTLLMLSAFTLAILTFTGVVRVEHVIALAAFNGVVSSFDMPGRQAFVVKMVGTADLPNAIALNSLMFNTARMIGPAMAGLLIAAVGIPACFFLNGLSYLAVIWSLLAMTLASELAAQAGASLIAQLRGGFSYLRRHRASLTLLLLSAISNGFGSQYTVLLPFFARNLLGGGARAYGFLLAAQGLGAAGGAVILASRADTSRRLTQHVVTGMFAAACAILIFGLSPWLGLAMLAQVLVGVGLTNSRAGINTLLQLFVSDDLRGRVMSFYTLSATGMAPFGALEVGFVGEHLGPRTAVVLCSGVAFCCATILATRFRLIAAASEE